MTVKFRVGFTLSGETLFALIAKMLPVEDLNVEELQPAVVNRLATIAVRLAPHKAKRATPGPNLTKGINAIIIDALKERPMRAVELQPIAKSRGFSPNSINSRLEELRKLKLIERVGDGTWRLKDGA